MHASEKTFVSEGLGLIKCDKHGKGKKGQMKILFFKIIGLGYS